MPASAAARTTAAMPDGPMTQPASELMQRAVFGRLLPIAPYDALFHGGQHDGRISPSACISRGFTFPGTVAFGSCACSAAPLTP